MRDEPMYPKDSYVGKKIEKREAEKQLKSENLHSGSAFYTTRTPWNMMYMMLDCRSRTSGPLPGWFSRSAAASMAITGGKEKERRQLRRLIQGERSQPPLTARGIRIGAKGAVVEEGQTVQLRANERGKQKTQVSTIILLVSFSLSSTYLRTQNNNVLTRLEQLGGGVDRLCAQRIALLWAEEQAQDKKKKAFLYFLPHTTYGAEGTARHRAHPT